MTAGDMQRDAAGPAAEIEDVPAGEIDAGKHPVDLLRPARRKIALAPEHAEEADRRLVVFRLRRRPVPTRCRHGLPAFTTRPAGAFSSAEILAHNQAIARYLLNDHSEYLDNILLLMQLLETRETSKCRSTMP